MNFRTIYLLLALLLPSFTHAENSCENPVIVFEKHKEVFSKSQKSIRRKASAGTPISLTVRKIKKDSILAIHGLKDYDQIIEFCGVPASTVLKNVSEPVCCLSPYPEVFKLKVLRNKTEPFEISITTSETLNKSINEKPSEAVPDARTARPL